MARFVNVNRIRVYKFLEFLFLKENEIKSNRKKLFVLFNQSTILLSKFLSFLEEDEASNWIILGIHIFLQDIPKTFYVYK